MVCRKYGRQKWSMVGRKHGKQEAWKEGSIVCRKHGRQKGSMVGRSMVSRKLGRKDAW